MQVMIVKKCSCGRKYTECDLDKFRSDDKNTEQTHCESCGLKLSANVSGRNERIRTFNYFSDRQKMAEISVPVTVDEFDDGTFLVDVTSMGIRFEGNDIIVLRKTVDAHVIKELTRCDGCKYEAPKSFIPDYFLVPRRKKLFLKSW